MIIIDYCLYLSTENNRTIEHHLRQSLQELIPTSPLAHSRALKETQPS